MTYDLGTHRYTLTIEYFNKYFNVNLTDLLINKTDVDPDAVARVFLTRVSNVFYNYILRGAKDYEKSVYLLSLPRFRDGILEGMLELGYSFIVNNADKSVFHLCSISFKYISLKYVSFFSNPAAKIYFSTKSSIWCPPRFFLPLESSPVSTPNA